MISFKSLSLWWNEFFYTESDPSTLGVYRIILGFFLFLNGISLIPDFEVWYGVGVNSLVPLKDSLEFYSNLRLNLFKWLSPTESSAWFVLVTYTISAFFLMIGFKTRLSSIVCFLLLVSLQNRNYAILNSGDTIMRCMLFLVMLSPCHLKYSIDSFLRRKQGEVVPSYVPATFLRLLQLQFSIVYLATTLFKLKGYDWVDGTAVYYTSRLENFQRIIIPYVFDFSFLIKTITWSALLIEFSMGSLIWIKEYRKWVLLAGIMLHAGIELTMNIGFFEWIMMGSYVLFLEKDEFDRIFSPIKSLFLKFKKN